MKKMLLTLCLLATLATLARADKLVELGPDGVIIGHGNDYLGGELPAGVVWNNPEYYMTPCAYLTHDGSNVVMRSQEEIDAIDTHTVTKTALVLAAEQTYLATWAATYGAGDTTYTNASRGAVALRCAAVYATNPSLMALSYPMERSFNTIQEWWSSVSSYGEAFHPYPWGLTNVVIRRGEWIKE